jgi:hypothetical protein
VSLRNEALGRIQDGSQFQRDRHHFGDRPCGLVVRVPGYRSTGPGFDIRR